jgi:hypothetical protein
MNEIRCPSCGKVFQVDEAGYAAIVAQVHTEQFEKEIAGRLKAAQSELEAKQQVAMAQEAGKYRQALAEKEQEIVRLREQAKNLNDAKQKEMEALRATEEMRRSRELAEKDREIIVLRDSAKSFEQDKQLAVTLAVQQKNTEITELRVQIEQEKQATAGKLQSMEENHRHEVTRLEEEIERYRDFKLRQSTKMIGEDLEQHCLNAFNEVRMMAFPNAYFEKDNEVVEGTKGDFVYREDAEDGIPLLSIMFEMKNEADATEKKHANTDFLDKLDKDRQKKNCEYAVLVTMLEPDNELYNGGIVTAYQYPKMYIVRPQFFIPLISLLRNAALSNLQTRRELAMVRQQNLDVQQFEAALVDFRDKFGRNYELASKHFSSAIDEIDQTIKHLEKVKDYLTKSENQYRLANDKAQDLSIKKLTKGNPTMQEKFEQAGISVE